MLKRDLTYEKSATGTRLRKFGLALQASRPFLSRANRLFFLCGANRSPGVPSVRRETIKQFVEKLSPEHRVIYAEGVFSELSKIGHSKNVLDLEHEISAIADKILIILESPSAFCELGAFAHPTLRKKLIIINDSQFRGNGSFIDTGPIAAATEAKSPVLWYPMDVDGVSNLDGIGAVFSDLEKALGTKPTTSATAVPLDVTRLSADKFSLYFIHDLVLFAGPVTHKELISVLIEAFGQRNFDIANKLLGVLREARLVYSFDVGSERVYRTAATHPFLRYSTNTTALMAAFRRFHLKTNPNRFVYA